MQKEEEGRKGGRQAKGRKTKRVAFLKYKFRHHIIELLLYLSSSSKSFIYFMAFNAYTNILVIIFMFFTLKMRKLWSISPIVVPSAKSGVVIMLFDHKALL